MTPEQKLADYARDYDNFLTEYKHLVTSYREANTEAARAEAAYKSGHAQAVLRHKASRDRMSQAEAETRADADEDMFYLHFAKLTTRSDVDGYYQDMFRMSEQMKGVRALVDAIREVMRSERVSDSFHASGYTGAA
jgi:hypothetical protein